MRHEIIKSLLFVVDKVDTCLRLDIDELFLIGPKIEQLVSKIVLNYKRNSIGCMKNVRTCDTLSALMLNLNCSNNHEDIFWTNIKEMSSVEIDICLIGVAINSLATRSKNRATGFQN